MYKPAFQHIEPGFVSHAERLSDDLYPTVLDSVVISCVDVIVVKKRLMLLGKRVHEPCAGEWWVIGGRKIPGETHEATATRILLREIGLTIDDPARFHYIGTKSYVWRRRAQPPQNHGCHMDGHNMVIHVTNAEADRVRGSSDFSSMRWADTDDMLLYLDNDNYHPAIVDFAHIVQERFCI